MKTEKCTFKKGQTKTIYPAYPLLLFDCRRGGNIVAQHIKHLTLFIPYEFELFFGRSRTTNTNIFTIFAK